MPDKKFNDCEDTGLEKKKEENLSETFNKSIENIKKNPSELKNTIAEIAGDQRSRGCKKTYQQPG